MTPLKNIPYKYRMELISIRTKILALTQSPSTESISLVPLEQSKHQQLSTLEWVKQRNKLENLK